MNDDHYFMHQALKQAQRAYQADEVPIGAIIVREDKIIARAFNQVEMLRDATAHAEILVITQAEAALGDWRLNECDLYVTKEPCPMCAGAVVLSRLRRVIFGCHDPRGGAAGGFINLLQTPNLGHRCLITGGVCEEESRHLLQAFFGEKRAERKSVSIPVKG
ncbi:MAG: tRNA adenosine(34) deaminase TadA [Chthoniobacterales bacterium]|nr:tRNA adenosine(34) deaminase TadA [Chthoniobacterales bacterium]